MHLLQISPAALSSLSSPETIASISSPSKTLARCKSRAAQHQQSWRKGGREMKKLKVKTQNNKDEETQNKYDTSAKAENRKKFLVPALLLAQLWTTSAPCLQYWDFNTWWTMAIYGGKNATSASDNTSLSLWGPKCLKGDWFNTSDCGTLGMEKEALARAQVKIKTDFSRSIPGSFYLHPFTSVDLSKFLVLSLRVIAVLITWGIGDLGDKEKEKTSSSALNIALLLPKPLPPPSPSHILQASIPPNHTHPATAPSCRHILIS